MTVTYGDHELVEGTDYELVCYFYYVECLYDRDETQIEEAVRRVKAAYRIYPSWRILWVLVNLDETYNRQQGLKLDSLLDCFEQLRCNSPIMYLEARRTEGGGGCPQGP